MTRQEFIARSNKQRRFSNFLNDVSPFKKAKSLIYMFIFSIVIGIFLTALNINFVKFDTNPQGKQVLNFRSLEDVSSIKNVSNSFVSIEYNISDEKSTSFVNFNNKKLENVLNFETNEFDGILTFDDYKNYIVFNKLSYNEDGILDDIAPVFIKKDTFEIVSEIPELISEYDGLNHDGILFNAVYNSANETLSYKLDDEHYNFTDLENENAILEIKNSLLFVNYEYNYSVLNGFVILYASNQDFLNATPALIIENNSPVYYITWDL